MDTFLTYILILIHIFALLSVVSSLIKKRNKNSKTYQYTKKKYLLSKTESDFFKTLENILNNQYYIFPQIHLSSLLDEKVVGQNWKGALSHIQRKSVDYVICDKVYLSPLLAIEFDDSSHQKSDSVKRDTEVERILEEAGIPLLRIPYSDMNNRELIRQELLEILS